MVLYCINPFFDYYFTLPTGQQVLMLDWGKDENLLFPITHRGKGYPYAPWQARSRLPGSRRGTVLERSPVGFCQ